MQSPSPNRRRSFNQFERNEIYRRADGTCQYCGAPIDGDNWEADHVIPFSLGGRTAIDNGALSCAPCNRRKGIGNLPMYDENDPDELDMTDQEHADWVLKEAQTASARPYLSVVDSLTSMPLRSFQRELASTVISRTVTGLKSTTAWVSPGSGKTYAWMLPAQYLYEQGLIDGVMVYVPRLSLQDQAERDCNTFRQKCRNAPMGEIVGRGNVVPLILPDKFGGVFTYQSLARDSANPINRQLHFNWAEQHSGRFLLVCDEAQFIGDANAEGEGGTIAASSIKALHDHALHTILLTGTPFRSDDNPIALADYTTDKEGMWLDWHARADYKRGVREGYLRPVEFTLVNADGTLTKTFDDGGVIKQDFEIESYDGRLGAVVKNPTIWQSLVIETAETLKRQRTISPTYRALIACADQSHARDVVNFLQKKYPRFDTVLAISDETRAKDTLNAFRPRNKYGSNDGDILVTVGMAYIVYDCPSISTVGVLSRTRFDGWLEQLIMRGGRMWSDLSPEDQTLQVIAPNDPKMAYFAIKFRRCVEEALKQRQERDGGSAPRKADFTTEVENARITGQILYGTALDGSLDVDDPAELAELKALQETLARKLPLSDIAAVRRASAQRGSSGAPPPKSDEPDEPADTRTARERIQEIKKEMQRQLSRLVIADLGLRGTNNAFADSRFGQGMKVYNGKLKKFFGGRDTDALTEAELRQRLAMITSGRVRGLR